jgi:hypothetical protein
VQMSYTRSWCVYYFVNDVNDAWPRQELENLRKRSGENWRSCQTASVTCVICSGARALM